jgi:uncharacterized protein YjaZ
LIALENLLNETEKDYPALEEFEKTEKDIKKELKNEKDQHKKDVLNDMIANTRAEYLDEVSKIMRARKLFDIANSIIKNEKMLNLVKKAKEKYILSCQEMNWSEYRDYCDKILQGDLGYVAHEVE